MIADSPARDHTVALDDEWRLWRRFVVRGAGLPESRVLALAAPRTARAIDRLFVLEAEAERLRADGEAIIHRVAREQGLTRPERRRLVRELSSPRAEAAIADPAVAAAVEGARAAASAVLAARAAADGELAAERVAVAEAIRAVAVEGRFREAVTWQNLSATRVLDQIQRTPATVENFKTRQDRRVVASYLQRYCVKADTIGFFGPVGWGTFDPRRAATEMAPGPRLLARRQVYFEYWAIDALAQRLAQQPDLRGCLAPRRNPTVRLVGRAAVRASGERIDLTDEAVALFAASDGEHSARALAGSLGLDETVVAEALADLADRGLLLWTLEVPVGDPRPERALRRSLEAIEAPSLRLTALAALTTLEARRDDVQRAAGDAAALVPALERANATFTELTAAAATRFGGKTYAGRTILYEDCMRDLALTVGEDLLAPLRAPLSLVLASARWFSHRVVARFRALFGEIYDALRTDGEGADVPFARFWEGVSPHVAGGSAVQTGKRSALAQEIEAELQARWSSLLALSPEVRTQRFRSDELSPRVREAFAAPDCGIELMRYHSPDLSVAAESAAAIARGEFSFVLSELHAGANTIARPLFLEQCPFPDELIAARTIDLPSPELFPVMPKDMHLRFTPVTYKPDDLHFETAEARSWLPRERVFAVADLTVRREGGAIRVCAPDGRSFEAADFLSSYLVRASVQSFTLAPPLPHTPRITIDRLVVAREAWRVAPAEIPFLDEERELERFVAARRWARALGLPRFVFYKIPEEKKPFFLDLESPIYLDLFCASARKASRLVLTEMLPAIGESWLTDGERDRYVCELRVVAVDSAVAASRAASRSSHR